MQKMQESFEKKLNESQEKINSIIERMEGEKENGNSNKEPEESENPEEPEEV